MSLQRWHQGPTYAVQAIRPCPLLRVGACEHLGLDLNAQLSTRSHVMPVGRVSQLRHGTNQHEGKVDVTRVTSTNVSTGEAAKTKLWCEINEASEDCSAD